MIEVISEAIRREVPNIEKAIHNKEFTFKDSTDYTERISLKEYDVVMKLCLMSHGTVISMVEVEDKDRPYKGLFISLPLSGIYSVALEDCFDIILEAANEHINKQVVELEEELQELKKQFEGVTGQEINILGAKICHKAQDIFVLKGKLR